MFNSTDRRGSPETISVKFYLDVNRWPTYQIARNIAENFNHLSRAHERYRQTDDRRTGDDIRSLKKRENRNKIAF